MGRDLKKLFAGHTETKNEILTIIESELKEAEHSTLISHIMKSNSILNYDQVYRALESIVNELRKE
ncbi:hypothetical protein [Flavobacterium sp. DSR3-2]|uniref:hypothetical protein n=1 Tax=Flavobacterium sp. DSR3-2 TaxID=2804634 RepID=UPI003CEF5914